MKTWQKIILIILTITGISFFIKWWMTYESMEIYVKNEYEDANVSIMVESLNGGIYFNKTFFLPTNGSIKFSNITNLAGNYMITVNADNASISKKVKFGKYFERIEIFIREGEIIIRNRRV